MNRLLVILLLLGTAIALSGCTEGVERRSVTGAVTLDNEPLASGSILFSPVGEGPSAGGEIVAGRYTLEEARGPAPGRYRVAISAWKVVGPEQVDEATGFTIREPIPIVPPRYNTHTELEVEIRPDTDNVCDFDLTSSVR